MVSPCHPISTPGSWTVSCPSRRRAPKRAAARRPVPCVVATKATKKTNDDDVRVNNDDGVENAPIPARSFPRRRALASFAALAAAASTSASASAADLESLESIAQDVNKQIMRQVDPRRAYYDQAEVELEMELGAPPQGEPSLRPGVTPGDPENGERDVVTTASGLQYAGVVVGRGEPIRTADLVVAHVSSGVEFENTYARGAALSFTMGVRPPGVCEGLEEAISTMRMGGTRLVAVPWTLGFGERGLRAPLAMIPPNAALRYEVQVLRCVPSGRSGEERLCCSDVNFPCNDAGRAFADEGSGMPVGEGGGGGGDAR